MSSLTSACLTGLSADRATDPDVARPANTQRKGIAISRADCGLLESVATPIVITALSDGAALFVNEAARQMYELPDDFRIPPADQASHLASRYYADPAARAAMLDDLAANGEVTGREIEFVSARGRRFWALLSGRPTTFETIPALLSSVVDISVQKARETQFVQVTDQLRAQAAESLLLNRELQRQQQVAIVANRAKSDFLARMSHELRSPLNAILGFSEIIGDNLFGDSAHDRYRNYARNIQEAGTHLLALINDILDLSKVEAGRFELSLEPVELGDLIRSCLPIVAPLADRRGVNVTAELDPAAGSIEADRLRLRQVVLNLLSNAVKFTLRNGDVTIRAVDAGDEVLIEVVDSGIGMSPEQIEVALQPFGQVMTESPYAQVGTGLGLPIVVSLVELHAGSFAIDSKPHAGTRVAVRLPRRRNAPADA